MKSDIWNISYIELQIWNQVSYDYGSYERNLSNYVYKPEKVRTSTGYEPVTSRYQCNALTNRAGHLWVLMSPWGINVKWYMKYFLYWTADLKPSRLWSWQLWTQFKQLRIEAWKSQNFNGVWTRVLAKFVRMSSFAKYQCWTTPWNWKVNCLVNF